MTDNTIAFTRMRAVSKDLIYIATTPEAQELGVKFTGLCQYADEAWSYETLRLAVADMALFRKPGGKHRIMHILSEDGAVYNVYTKLTETIAPSDAAFRARHRPGLFRRIRQLGDTLIAIGGGGQNYKRGADGRWTVLDEGLFDGPDRGIAMTEELLAKGRPSKEEIEAYNRIMQLDASKTLWSIDGRSESDFYVCCNEGRIFRFNGEKFEEARVEGSHSLTAVLFESRDRVWACGREGTLLLGNLRDGFRVVDEVVGAPSFTSLAMLEGRLYIGSIAKPRGLFVLDGTGVHRVRSEPNIDDVSTIQAVDGVLWVMGNHNIARFDGTSWKRIPFPPNCAGQALT